MGTRGPSTTAGKWSPTDAGGEMYTRRREAWARVLASGGCASGYATGFGWDVSGESARGLKTRWP